MPEALETPADLPPPITLRRGSFEITYFTLGPTGGWPLVLCHGLAASGLQFHADAVYFAAKGFYVIVPDLRGHGRSRAPAIRRDEDFTIPAIAADLLAILETERLGATNWVGNSLGGILGLSIMATDPSRVRKFVSFGTAYALDVPGVLIPFAGLAARIAGPELVARTTAFATSRNRSARALICEVLRTIDLDAVLRTARGVRTYDFIDTAKAWPGPILMLQAGRDYAVNRALGRTLRAMQDQPHFTLQRIADAAHCANLDQPNRTRALIEDFLRAPLPD